MSNFTNNYIPEFVPDNLPWYERDGLMTYIDKLKYDDFIRFTDSHFKNTRVVNFDIIRKQARGERIDSDLLKSYRTIDTSRIGQYPDKQKNQALSSAFRSPRKDIKKRRYQQSP